MSVTHSTPQTDTPVPPTPPPDTPAISAEPQPTRLACHALIERLPDAALAGALLALTDVYEDYLASLLPPRPLPAPREFPVKFRYGGTRVSRYPAVLELD